jgi:raffinose/stachyose/melibiose transport system permease protein
LSIFSRSRERREPSKIPYYVLLIILALFALGPLVIMIFNSLKSSAEIGRNPLGLPLSPVFENFPVAWTQGNFSTTMVNSIILTVGTVVGVCIIAGTSAYAMARLDLPGTDAVLLYLFVASAVPFQLFLVPLFFLWSTLHLTNTRFGLLQVMLRVVLPLSWPGLLTVALVSGVQAWNEFFLAITFIQDKNLKPVTTSFLAFQSTYSQEWGLTSAAAIYIILPIVVLFLILQRRFISGLTAGGLKG